VFVVTKLDKKCSNNSAKRFASCIISDERTYVIDGN